MIIIAVLFTENIVILIDCINVLITFSCLDLARTGAYSAIFSLKEGYQTFYTLVIIISEGRLHITLDNYLGFWPRAG